jgi:deazaflavin-dependent oxidoreductase (nitroreductase family)
VTPGTPAGALGTAGAIEPVRPALLVRVVIRPLTRLLNPVILKRAGGQGFQAAAQIRHTGRRSGRPYVTPASARRCGDVIIVPLTFGNQSDWVRNIVAAGRCSIRLDGQDYEATEPRFLSRDQAGELLKSMFSPMERASFRVLGIRQLLRLRATPRAHDMASGPDRD